MVKMASVLAFLLWLCLSLPEADAGACDLITEFTLVDISFSSTVAGQKCAESATECEVYDWDSSKHTCTTICTTWSGGKMQCKESYDDDYSGMQRYCNRGVALNCSYTDAISKICVCEPVASTSPSVSPSAQPTTSPSISPSTTHPTTNPSQNPTSSPSESPATAFPSDAPSTSPSASPATSSPALLTASPTSHPATASPATTAPSECIKQPRIALGGGLGDAAVQMLWVDASDTVSVSASATPAPCLQGNALVRTGVRGWRQVFGSSDLLLGTQFASNVSDHIITLASSQSASLLSIAPSNLRMGQRYAFEVSASSEDIAIAAAGGGGGLQSPTLLGNSSKVVVLAVRQRSVYAAIRGGANRTVATSSSSPGYKIIFSGEASFDPANRTKTPLANWTLQALGGGSSPAVTTDATNPLKAYVPSDGLTPNTQYRLTLQLTGIPLKDSRGLETPRSSEAHQLIFAAQSEAPTVSIQIDATGPNPPAASDKISLTLKSDNVAVSRLSVVWGCSAGGLDLNDGATRSQTLRTGINSPSLVFRPNALLPGTSYVFSATTTALAGGSSSVATIAFTTNSAPTGGACSSDRSSGDALETQFTFSCSGWADTDVPIRYAFEALLLPERTTGTETALPSILCPLGVYSSCSTLLPSPAKAAANPGTPSPLTIRIHVADYYRAFAAPVNVSVSVTQPVLTPVKISDLEKAMNESALSGDPAAAAVVMTGLASYLEGASDSAVNTATRVSIRRSMASTLQTYLSARKLGTEELQVRLPSEMARSAAQTDSSGGPSELDAEACESIISAVETLNDDALNTFSDEISTNIASAVSGVISFIQNSEDENGALGQRTALTEQVETSLSKLARGSLKNAKTGEEAQTISSSILEVLTQRLPIASLGEKRYTTSQNSSIQLPSESALLAILRSASTSAASSSDDDGSLGVSLVSIGGAGGLYAEKTANQERINASDIGGTMAVELETQEGQILNVTGLDSSDAFRISLATPAAAGAMPSAASSLSVNGPRAPTCVFWDETSKSWSESGLQTNATASGNEQQINCKSSHLTMFSVHMRLSVGVNTFGEDDVNEDVFSLGNTVFIASISIIGLAVLALVATYFYDSHIQSSDDNFSVDFWRDFNYQRKIRVQSMARSLKTFREVSYWSLRRKHPWMALCIRHPGDFVTSMKRILILTVLVFNTMALCALLVGQEQQLPMMGVGVSTALIAMLMALPIPITMTTVFRRHVPKHLAVSVVGQDHLSSCFGWMLLLSGLLGGELMIEDMGGGDDDGEGMDAEEEDGDDNLDEADDDEHNKDQGESSDSDEDGGDAKHTRSLGLAITTGAVAATGGENFLSKSKGEREDKAKSAAKEAGLLYVLPASSETHDSNEAEPFKARSRTIAGGVLPALPAKERKAMEGREAAAKSALSRPNELSGRRNCHEQKRSANPELSSTVVSDEVLVGSEDHSADSQADRLELNLQNHNFSLPGATPTSGPEGSNPSEESSPKVSDVPTTSNQNLLASHGGSSSKRFNLGGGGGGGGEGVLSDDREKKELRRKRKMFVSKRTGNMVFTPARSSRSKAGEGVREEEEPDDNHVWTKWDRIGFALGITVILGCCFITSVLSWKMKFNAAVWLESTFLSFGQDFCFRILQIAILEALCFLPLAWCCCAAPNSAEKANEDVYMFTAGYVGFSYKRLIVMNVDADSQAEAQGIRRGMQIYEVDHTAVKDDREASRALFVAHRTRKIFTMRIRKINFLRS
eukprot:jgi/Bigna1/75687/fgenesh1_pg.36_\